MAEIGLLLAQGEAFNPAVLLQYAPWLAIGLLAYFMLMRPHQRERAEMKSMLDGLKKNQRVVTIGGIYGTVVTAEKGSEDVTLKVDENGNARIRVLRSAISRVIKEDKQNTA